MSAVAIALVKIGKKIAMPEIKFARSLAIPIEAVTQTVTILAKRGAGKTYTALVLVEEMLSLNLPVVVIDPVDEESYYFSLLVPQPSICGCNQTCYLIVYFYL